MEKSETTARVKDFSGSKSGLISSKVVHYDS